MQGLRLSLLVFLGFASLSACAEPASTPILLSPAISLSAYLETYYAYDGMPSTRRPDFLYSHAETNQPSIHLALIKASLDRERIRARLALASGTYMRANYAAESAGLRQLFEANVGLRLSDTHDVWLDVGVMPSHIGVESAIGLENWTLTRSLMADNSPYYETGAKLSLRSADQRWQASALLLTGWQRITPTQSSTAPAFGHQLTFRPSSALTLNSSSFIGNVSENDRRQMRYFHDAYLQWQLTERAGLIAALDIGAQQAAPGSDRLWRWWSSSLMLRVKLSDQLYWAGRIERFDDPHAIIASGAQGEGLEAMGYSMNLDYQLTPHLAWRNEVRHLHSQSAAFARRGLSFSDERLTATTALIMHF